MTEKVTFGRPYDAARAALYPSAPDQLDAIFKGFRAIRDSGLIQLPPETLAWLEYCELVKERCPKG